MITLDNFEIYLIDYADGCLSPEKEAELKTFLLLHPELEEESEDFDQVRLTPPTITYRHKDFLKQIVSENPASIEDGPHLIPDLTIRFEKKAILYRKNRTLVFWGRMSAAAIILLFLWAGFIHFYIRQPQTTPFVSSIYTEIAKETPLSFKKQIHIPVLTSALQLPTSLELKRTRPTLKKTILQLNVPSEPTAVSLPVEPTAQVKIPDVHISDSPEIILTEKAKEWKPSGDNFQSRNIITSVIHAGKNLADKIRKEEYTSR